MKPPLKSRTIAGLLLLFMSTMPAPAIESNAFLRRLEAELEAAGHRCEARSEGLLCTNEKVATYASAGPAIVTMARQEGERIFCGRYAARQIENGFFEGKAFSDVHVLSSSITDTGEIVCVMSYKR